MAGSKTPTLIGRGQFVLRFSLITALSYALDSIPRIITLFRLPLGHYDLRLLDGIVVFLLATSMIRAISGRCLDAVLPRWYVPMAFGAWILATFLLPGSRNWPFGVALTAALLIAGGSIPDKPEHIKLAAVVAQGSAAGALSGATVPLGLFNSPVSFLRTLLTFFCLGIPLIWVAEWVTQPVGPVIADFGFGILYFVWLTKTLGRFADSGHASNWYWGPFCIGVTAISFLLLEHHLINRYEALGLFLLIQTPLGLLPSQHEADRFNEDRLRRRKERVRKQREQRVARLRMKDPKPIRLGPFTFLRNLLIIDALWTLFLFWEKTSGGSVVMWFARSCYFILAIAWIMNVGSRAIDAGLKEGWYRSQFALVIGVASLMPLAFHWVNGYGALAIFFLIQTPTAFLRSKPVLEAAPSN